VRVAHEHTVGLAQLLPHRLASMRRHVSWYFRGTPHADALLRGKIFSAIFASEENIVYQKGDSFEFFPKISPVGLEDNESLFPYPTSVHKGFRLLQEYFSFPDKFYGFDVTIPESVLLSGEFCLYIPMNHDVSIRVAAGNFSLFSVPAINLFPNLSEPLRLDHKQVEYCLVSDYRRYRSHEIYTIEKMVAVDTTNNDEIEIKEFFSCDHGFGGKIFPLLWKSRRKKSYLKDALGDDVHISFVDLDFNPQFPADKIFYAHTLCTNRYAAEQIPVNGLLQIEISVPAKQIYCADRPTIQKPCIKSGEILWKLVSVLSLNSVSFSPEGISKLKEVLNVFADITRSNIAEEVDSIVSMNSSIVTRRIHDQVWNGFARGSNIEILFDEYIPNMGLPLSMVIAKFLSTYTAINTFTEVSVKNVSKNGVLKRWDQHFGLKNYL
jgi:type VI secretion system protein ImpG